MSLPHEKKVVPSVTTYDTLPPEASRRAEPRPKSMRAVFDGMGWPIPNHEIGWKMRYGNPTREERLQAAAEMDAYAALLVRSQKRRNYICKKIQEAMR